MKKIKIDKEKTELYFGIKCYRESTYAPVHKAALLTDGTFVLFHHKHPENEWLAKKLHQTSPCMCLWLWKAYNTMDHAPIFAKAIWYQYGKKIKTKEDLIQHFCYITYYNKQVGIDEIP